MILLDTLIPSYQQISQMILWGKRKHCFYAYYLHWLEIDGTNSVDTFYEHNFSSFPLVLNVFMIFSPLILKLWYLFSLGQLLNHVCHPVYSNVVVCMSSCHSFGRSQIDQLIWQNITFPSGGTRILAKSWSLLEGHWPSHAALLPSGWEPKCRSRGQGMGRSWMLLLDCH